MEQIKRWLNYLIFLPNINPVSKLLNAEIFPWAFLFSVVNKKIWIVEFKHWLLLLLMSGIFSMVFMEVSSFVLVRSLFPYLNAMLIFYAILAQGKEQLEKINTAFLWVLFVNLLVAALQHFSLFPTALTPAVRWVLPRFVDEPYFNVGNRGVPGLFAEPSYFSIAITYFLAYLLFIMKIPPNSLGGRLMLIFVTILQLFVAKSATGLVMFLVFVFALQSSKQIGRMAVVLIGLLVLIVYLALNLSNPPRALEIIRILIVEQKYKDLWIFMFHESGFRSVSVVAGWWYGLLHPLGCGVGNWGPASIDALESVGVPAYDVKEYFAYVGTQFEGVRPTSFCAGLMLETGLLGLFLFFRSLWSYVNNAALYVDPVSRAIVVLFFFNVFALGNIGDATPFLFLALVIVQKNHEETAAE